MNTIVNSNQEDAHNRVCVNRTLDGEVSIVVEDEDHGFEDDPVTNPTDNRRRTSNGGIYLVKGLMDDVRFEQQQAPVQPNQTRDAGGAWEEQSVYQGRRGINQVFEFCDECGAGEYAMKRLGHAKLCEACNEQAQRSEQRGTVVHLQTRFETPSSANGKTR
jgi:histidine kinase-like protein